MVLCPICSKDWDYHSEAESGSCGRKMCDIVMHQVKELEELWSK